MQNNYYITDKMTSRGGYKASERYKFLDLSKRENY